MDHHEAAAADIAGARVAHRHGKTDRNRGVYGIAAFLQHLDANAGGTRVLARDHPVARNNRLRRCDILEEMRRGLTRARGRG